MTRRWRRSTGLGLSVACATGVLMLGAATAASPAGGDTAPTVNARAFAGHGDLAFVSNGTLYVLDGATGALRRVADLPLDEGGPQFSPNGQWLLYPGATATSFLARSDGTGARKLPGSANWLPDGDLSVSTGSAPKASVVGSNGTLHPAPSSASSARPVGTGTEYVYETSTLQVTAARKPAHGVVRVETSNTPNGPRTLWYQAKNSFTPEGGLAGTFVNDVTVLPDHLGLVMAIEPSCCDWADGVPLYELRTPGGTPQKLGNTMTVIPSFGPDDSFAVTIGGDRYAWSKKTVELCDAVTARCARETDQNRVISLSPAWSPDHQTLAFIEASPEPEAMTGQAQIDAWYSTHHLYLLSSQASKPQKVGDTLGAAQPVWSRDSKSLLFVDHNALYLIPKSGAAPVEVAGPLFLGGVFPDGHGTIHWSEQFAWTQAA